jgi:fructose-1,6-bisphosphatase/inositol monophosphatase family enzyme
LPAGASCGYTWPMSPRARPAAFASWRERLVALTDLLRVRTREALLSALREGRLDELAQPHAHGVGDVTFGLDLPSERAIAEWLERTARETPLSVLTEDSGWSHRGPDGRGGSRVLEGFDHGGPRIAIDPVDGTRNLMADLRPAWTVVAFAPPGPTQPRLADLTGGLVSELPGTLAAGYRRLSSDGEVCTLETRDLGSDELQGSRALTVDDDDRVDGGYFPFFRYEPAQRPAIARLEASFFAHLVDSEGCDARSIYDDQYCSSAGQLVQLALGRYRMVVDPREWVHRRRGAPGVTSKPYDLAGAVVCARAAGAVVLDVEGGPLDFPIDATTPVGYLGFANEPTRRRLLPWWRRTLQED